MGLCCSMRLCCRGGRLGYKPGAGPGFILGGGGGGILPKGIRPPGGPRPPKISGGPLIPPLLFIGLGISPIGGPR